MEDNKDLLIAIHGELEKTVKNFFLYRKQISELCSAFDGEMANFLQLLKRIEKRVDENVNEEESA